jgi:hypothetical protein
MVGWGDLKSRVWVLTSQMTRSNATATVNSISLCFFHRLFPPLPIIIENPM